MFKTNEYFDGKVLSIGFKNDEGKATVGVMAPGQYEFGTSTIEHMTVTSGIMHVQLPGETSWRTYKPFETFIVQANASFHVKVDADTTYKCVYK